MHAKPIAELSHELAKLPGIGPKTATKLALYIVDSPPGYATTLANRIVNAKTTVKKCQNCFNLSDKDICDICTSPKRNPKQICVVPDSRDVVAILNTHEYKGLFFVLGGVISPIDGIGPEQLNIGKLINRIQEEKIEEVILALPPGVESDTTALYIAQMAGLFAPNVTRIACGIPINGELEQADPVTLARALNDRRRIESAEF